MSDKANACFATNVIREYIGRTGPKAIQNLDEGIDEVLSIDKAHRFRNGHFAKEAIDEPVDCLTKPRYKGKVTVLSAA